jgi:chloramphenicol-sensitive protein RarD
MNLRRPVEETRPAPAAQVRGLVAPAGTRAGILYGVGAYGLWGVLPVYFKAVKQVPALEVLAHRVIWSLVFLLLLLLVRRNWRAGAGALSSRRTLATLGATTLLIGGNWLLFIWAVANNHLLQASLGYFINPLVNVLLGLVFLGERLRGWQTVAVGLAAVGVGYLTLAAGHFPGIALFFAGSFGLYGLLRKTAKVDAMLGLTVETALLAPLALAFLGWQMLRGRAVFGGSSLPMDLLLMLAGVVTATPLLWFTEAARRLRLTTLGFLQYLSPTGHFLLAVLAFGEPLTGAHLFAFACTWAALGIYSVDGARAARPLPAAAASAPIE